MKIALIDDDGLVRRYTTDYLRTVGDVTEYAMIPDDISELEQFDALVVDNQGIGNGTYRNGVSFLKAWAKDHTKQTLVHYSGFVTKQDGDELASMGVKIATKGYRVEKVFGGIFTPRRDAQTTQRKWLDEIDRRIKSCNTDSVSSLKDTVEAIRQAMFYAKSDIPHPSELNQTEQNEGQSSTQIQNVSMREDMISVRKYARAILATTKCVEKYDD